MYMYVYTMYMYVYCVCAYLHLKWCLYYFINNKKITDRFAEFNPLNTIPLVCTVFAVAVHISMVIRKNAINSLLN